ncbi:hypothetical protein pEaSNUABM47_00359 [Erwinia phage pEa_SNUABM_47]|uniref:Uncharacterized protein n=1 Tax=Erwinia phage pEa_SNUABM_47 TaxID=2768774 RepID=A0A7L8ZN05_9CAUD|nr:hypothetical protein pEaSNUABM47_00359 [Erwinia phage pEa_SNUABM_47]QXO12610.1 hypothetical protein pEaSNUABM49_00364 [Erwinia phage pEa_SNUABM_49]
MFLLLLKYIFFQFKKFKNSRIFFYLAMGMPIPHGLTVLLCDLVFNIEPYIKNGILLVLLLLQVLSMLIYFKQLRKGYL